MCRCFQKKNLSSVFLRYAHAYWRTGHWRLVLAYQALEGEGQIRQRLSARAARSGEGGVGDSACSKPIVWFVLHGRFPIVKIAIGQN